MHSLMAIIFSWAESLKQQRMDWTQLFYSLHANEFKYDGDELNINSKQI